MNAPVPSLCAQFLFEQLCPLLSFDAMQDLSEPVGLRNEGSTCYLNSTIQCLYMIKRLRKAIFTAETEDKVIHQFRYLTVICFPSGNDKILLALMLILSCRASMAQMQAGDQRTLELSGLISLLGVDCHIQQVVFSSLTACNSRKLSSLHSTCQWM